MKNIFNLWNVKKQKINEIHQKKTFYEGNIIWFSCGKNIGSEIFGKGECFFRPAIILKKVFHDGYIIIPLSSQKREGSYYYSFVDSKKIVQYSLFHQVKYIDGKRISYKKSNLSHSKFTLFKEAFKFFL